MKNSRGLKSMLVMVLVALAASGSSALAAEVKVNPGQEVEVSNGDTVVVKLPADKTQVVVDDTAKAKPADPAPKPKVEEVVKPQPKIMVDDFSSPASSPDVVDLDSVVEVAIRGFLSPSGPAIGGTLGFSYRPANRWRLYTGFNAGKGLLELKGEEKELVQLGFTAGVSRVVTPTVEGGLFATMSWSYRDLVKDMSASFIGAGPGFRLNKAGGLVFFEASLPIGYSKKFADGPWEFSTALQVSAGFHL